MFLLLLQYLLVFCSALIPLAPLDAKEAKPAEPVVVLGGGVGGLTSALYLARAGLSPLVIEGESPGGLLTQSHSVQNWPGEMEITGGALTDKMRKQAEASGARFLRGEVVGIDFSKRPLRIKARSFEGKTKEISALSCIIAMGTKPKFLHVPGEGAYWGKGVSNCAVCDGSLYRDQIVGVVGGGDAAVLEALYLSEIAKEVLVFVRKERFKGIEEQRLDALFSRPNVKILYNTSVEKVKGDGQKLTSVTLKQKDQTFDFPLHGLFLAIGSTPNTELFGKALKLDRGYIETFKGQETSLPGVYAVGDIVDPVYKQAVSAAGDAAKAALQAQKYLSETPGLVVKAMPKEVLFEAADQVIEISSLEQFQREIEGSEIPILVDFYATWCGPCKRLSPLLDTSAEKLGGRVKILKVNVDKLSKLTTSYQIQSMPTLLVFNAEGEVVERKVGTYEISDYLKDLEGVSGN